MNQHIVVEVSARGDLELISERVARHLEAITNREREDNGLTRLGKVEIC